VDRGDAAGVTQRLAVALTIAGSDSGGGAGIQADIKTFAALGVYGASVVTALTAQNTLTVRRIHFPSPEMVADQIDLALEDFNVAAIKIGMLGMAAFVEVAAERLASFSGKSGGDEGSRDRQARRSDSHSPDAFRADLSEQEGRAARSTATRPFIVYDPVMTASTGHPLSGASFVETVRASLLPLVDCLTPNLAEAAVLLGEKVAGSEADMVRQGAALLKLGPRAVLMKGGHLDGSEAVDFLATAEGVRRYAAPRIASRNLHGTGCTLSSAIAAHVVLGMALPEAVAAAKAFVGEAIERGREVKLGMGDGPLIQAKLR
jgi:hydroxymethylpyrimidine/phosphomethylpyrimidine kinase